MDNTNNNYKNTITVTTTLSSTSSCCTMMKSNNNTSNISTSLILNSTNVDNYALDGNNINTEETTFQYTPFTYDPNKKSEIDNKEINKDTVKHVDVGTKLEEGSLSQSTYDKSYPVTSFRNFKILYPYAMYDTCTKHNIPCTMNNEWALYSTEGKYQYPLYRVLKDGYEAIAYHPRFLADRIEKEYNENKIQRTKAIGEASLFLNKHKSTLVLSEIAYEYNWEQEQFQDIVDTFSTDERVPVDVRAYFNTIQRKRIERENLTKRIEHVTGISIEKKDIFFSLQKFNGPEYKLTHYRKTLQIFFAQY